MNIANSELTCEITRIFNVEQFILTVQPRTKQCQMSSSDSVTDKLSWQDLICSKTYKSV